MPDLHQHGLALGHLLADAGAAFRTRESAGVAGAEEGVLAQATVDESAVDIAEHPAHAAKADGADPAGRAVGEVGLDQAVVIEQPQADAARHAVDDQHPAHGSGLQPRPRRRSRVTASGRPTTFDQLPLIAATKASARPWMA